MGQLSEHDHMVFRDGGERPEYVVSLSHVEIRAASNNNIWDPRHSNTYDPYRDNRACAIGLRQVSVANLIRARRLMFFFQQLLTRSQRRGPVSGGTHIQPQEPFRQEMPRDSW